MKTSAIRFRGAVEKIAAKYDVSTNEALRIAAIILAAPSEEYQQQGGGENTDYQSLNNPQPEQEESNDSPFEEEPSSNESFQQKLHELQQIDPEMAQGFVQLFSKELGTSVDEGSGSYGTPVHEPPQVSEILSLILDFKKDERQRGGTIRASVQKIMAKYDTTREEATRIAKMVLAIDQVDPKEQELDNAMVQLQQQHGQNLPPEKLQYARERVMEASQNQQLNPEEYQAMLAMYAGMNEDPNAQRLAHILAANSGPLRCPACKGKVAKSLVYPDLFGCKNRHVSRLKLSGIPLNQTGPGQPMQSGQPETDQEFLASQGFVPCRTCQGTGMRGTSTECSYCQGLGMVNPEQGGGMTMAYKKADPGQMGRGRTSPPLSDSGHYKGQMGSSPAQGRGPDLSDSGNYRGNMGADPQRGQGRGSQRDQWFEMGRQDAEQGMTMEEAEETAAQILSGGNGGMVAHDSYLAGVESVSGGSTYTGGEEDMEDLGGGRSPRRSNDVDYSGLEDKFYGRE